jgi:adenylate cyclase
MVLPRFLAELKRRKVYRVAMVYSGVGWVLLEAADVVFPRLGLPDWTVNLVLALIAVGFPIAIVFAWIFDFSTQGVVRTQPITPEEHHLFSLTSIVEFVLIVVLVIIVGYLYVDRLSLQKRLIEPELADSRRPGAGQPAIPRAEQYRAIAVLPFADMSEAGDQAWFAEGVAEELLHGLASVDELYVMARTSSFAFKDTDKTIAEIADILGVQAVLEGSVRRAGDRVRITAQLVDANSGFQVWSGSYERQVSDIFQLQDELARAIARALRVELGVGQPVSLVAVQTHIPEAYNWFMRGRALYDWGNPKISDQTISYFEKAVAADPDYALAWGYLAAARAASFLWRPFDEVNPVATAAYERALALDPEQSEALATKALVTLILEHDWEAAGKLYQRAMASTENTLAMSAYPIHYLAAIERFPQAIRLYAKLEKRDPLHADYKANLAGLLLWGGDAEGAIVKAREALELNPQHAFALYMLIDANISTGHYSAVRTVLEKIPPELQKMATFKARTGLYYVAIGDPERARLIYRDLVDTQRNWAILGICDLALVLGEVEEAIDLMELVVEQSSRQLILRTRYRHNNAVRNHPRYLALLKRIGLDDESVAALNSQLSFD